MENILIQKIDRSQLEDALSLVWEVFQQFEARDYKDSGVAKFYKSIHDEAYLSMLEVYGVYDAKQLVGVSATRSAGTHVALFFVKGTYHRQGIGKRLFQLILEECPVDRMTVNSSTYAVPIYHKLGFCDTDAEQVTNGVRFTPMERKGVKT